MLRHRRRGKGLESRLRQLSWLPLTEATLKAMTWPGMGWKRVETLRNPMFMVIYLLFEWIYDLYPIPKSIYYAIMAMMIEIRYDSWLIYLR